MIPCSVYPLCAFSLSLTEDDIDPLFRLVVFPGGSQSGDRQCVDVPANFDGIMEPLEFLILVIFEITGQGAEFLIDETRMFVPLFIIDSKRAYQTQFKLFCVFL